MALGLNKILISGTYENTPGAYWQGTSNITVSNTGTVIPAGTYIAFNTANVVIQAVSNYNTTSNVATWTSISPNNVGGVIISDGVNVQANIIANGANAAVLQLITVNGGQPVSGTYNS
jgi:hypothetical protein